MFFKPLFPLGCAAILIALFTSTCAEPSSDDIIRSVWDTTKSMNVDFCHHVYDHESPQYQRFFDHILNLAYQFTEPLVTLDFVQNIIIIQPDQIRCTPHTIYVVVETNQDTEQLKLRCKEFAVKIHHTANVIVSMVLKTKQTDFAWPQWQPRKGLYVFCRNARTALQSESQLVRNHVVTANTVEPLSQEEWGILSQLARRRRLEVITAWSDNDFLHVSVARYGSTANLQHFQQELEQRARKKVRIIV